VPADFYEEEEFATEFKGQTFKRILGLTRPHLKWVIGFLLTVVLVSILDAYFTYLSKRMVDEGIVAHNSAALVNILIQYGLLILVQACGVFGFIYMVGVIGERIRFDLRQQMFNHLQILSLSYYSKTPIGWIMARVTNDTERVVH
jgi:ATP-binding cassette subfamily B protein